MVDAIVEAVEHRRIVVNYLVQNLVQQKRSAALAGDGRGAELLLDVVDTAKHLVVISDDVIGPEKSVELDGVEFFGTDVGGYAVYDEVEIILKLLDLRIVSILATIFDRQRMKLK